MRVLITGASGLIGSALKSQLKNEGIETAQLTRRNVLESDRTRIPWHPESGTLDAESLEGFRTVVHLAGDNVANEPWTEAKKHRIYDSRVSSTTLLCRVLGHLKQKPKLLISASAIGYYGNRGDEILPESAELGQGFLAEVCRAWEQAAEPAAEAGIRVVNLRIGVVLSSEGGALQRMLPLYRMGLGGPVGLGRAWMSWIALDDLVSVILHCMNSRRVKGPVNAVAPNPVQNRDFAKALGKAVGRPAILPTPSLAIKYAMGEMGRELVLSSARVMPEQLEQSKFVWRYPTVEEALAACMRGKT